MRRVVALVLALSMVAAVVVSAAEEQHATAPLRDAAQIAIVVSADSDAEALELALSAVTSEQDEAEDAEPAFLEADADAALDATADADLDSAMDADIAQLLTQHTDAEADNSAEGFGDEEADDSDRPEPPECPETGHAGDSEQKTPWINQAYSDRSMCHHALWICGVRRGACMRGCVGDSYGFTIPKCAKLCNPQMTHCYNLVKERYSGGGGDE